MNITANKKQYKSFPLLKEIRRVNFGPKRIKIPIATLFFFNLTDFKINQTFDLEFKHLSSLASYPKLSLTTNQNYNFERTGKGTKIFV